jgi:hypothetical protein
MKEQIAKDLQESGLFGWLQECENCFGRGKIIQVMGNNHPVCQECSGSGFGDLPDADTSEAILAEMGLQVAWLTNSVHSDQWAVCQIGIHYEDHSLWADEDCDGENYCNFIQGFDPRDIEKGQRTLANNAALAWLSKQPEWIDKLKAAIEAVRGNDEF